MRSSSIISVILFVLTDAVHSRPVPICSGDAFCSLSKSDSFKGPKTQPFADFGSDIGIIGTTSSDGPVMILDAKALATLIAADDSTSILLNVLHNFESGTYKRDTSLVAGLVAGAKAHLGGLGHIGIITGVGAGVDLQGRHTSKLGDGSNIIEGLADLGTHIKVDLESDLTSNIGNLSLTGDGIVHVVTTENGVDTKRHDNSGIIVDGLVGTVARLGVGKGNKLGLDAAVAGVVGVAGI